MFPLSAHSAHDFICPADISEELFLEAHDILRFVRGQTLMRNLLPVRMNKSLLCLQSIFSPKSRNLQAIHMSGVVQGLYAPAVIFCPISILDSEFLFFRRQQAIPTPFHHRSMQLISPHLT
jgi:hypothetical protein